MNSLHVVSPGLLPASIRRRIAAAFEGRALEVLPPSDHPGSRVASGEADLAVIQAGEAPFPRPSGLRVQALLAPPGTGDAREFVLLARRGRPEISAALWSRDERLARGKVWIAGFGPGDPDLMTFRTHDVLLEADVILHDDLIGKSALDRYPGRKVYVGKRKHCHEMTQDAINENLYLEARAGRRVVRLKGGDPFIFGRGGEEAEFLARRHVPVEIIPGVSSANAAAAALGIPLTQRALSSTVVFRTLHGSTAGPGTRVYFMGATKLQELARDLLREGFSPSTPVALLRNVSGLDERTVVTDIAGLADAAVASPVIIIVGEVAGRGREPETWLRFDANAEAPIVAERVVTAGAETLRQEDPALFDGVMITGPDDLVRLRALFGCWPKTFLYLARDADAIRLLETKGCVTVPRGHGTRDARWKHRIPIPASSRKSEAHP